MTIDPEEEKPCAGCGEPPQDRRRYCAQCEYERMGPLSIPGSYRGVYGEYDPDEEDDRQVEGSEGGPSQAQVQQRREWGSRQRTKALLRRARRAAKKRRKVQGGAAPRG